MLRLSNNPFPAQILDLMHAFGVFNELELISGRAVRFCKLKNRKASDSQVLVRGSRQLMTNCRSKV
jgi:hypothetical protein